MFVASYHSTWGKPCFSKEAVFTLTKENKLYNKEKTLIHVTGSIQLWPLNPVFFFFRASNKIFFCALKTTSQSRSVTSSKNQAQLVVARGKIIGAHESLQEHVNLRGWKC